jgi:hypothetical protein
MGVAGATLAPSTPSLIRTMFLDDRQRIVAIGIWGTSFSLGGAIGPLVGGALLEASRQLPGCGQALAVTKAAVEDRRADVPVYLARDVTTADEVDAEVHSRRSVRDWTALSCGNWHSH